MNSSKKALFKDCLIREAEPEDSQAIWEIRNNPVIRKSSLSSDKISLEKHKRWFADQYFKDKLNLCLVLIKNEKVAGYCRFDKKGKEFLTSIAILPDEQGKGLGFLFLREALELVGSGKVILAQVKKSNPASLQIFFKSGFQVIKEEKDVLQLRHNG